MKHDIENHIDWCTQCGMSREAVVDKSHTDCRGAAGVVHIDYLRAEREHDRVFGPIMEAVMGSLR